MNTDNSSQVTPTMPAHYEYLSHPLIHNPESPSYVSCRDILHNSTYLLNLFTVIDINNESDSGGLTTQSAHALVSLTGTLSNTLRYVSLTLKDLQQEQLQRDKALRDSAFVQALHDSDEAYQQTMFGALAACLGITR
ncbi:hypothetical protein N9J88_02475, partial [Porticoccaceae bacterium]|nr:hypothetical protein [Porticoccaceae bacterium]